MDKLEDIYNIVVNKNSIPNDPRGVWETSGIRIGTAENMVTKMGANKEYFTKISEKIVDIIKKLIWFDIIFFYICLMDLFDQLEIKTETTGFASPGLKHM